jgi:homoserine dehydrogenase
VQSDDIRGARLLGGSVKLVAHAQRDGAAVTMSVRPTVVRAGHPLHGVGDADNAVLVSSDLAGRLSLRGLGAGGDSTASAVVSDIVATAADPGQAPPLPASRVEAGDDGAVERGGYLRVRLNPVADAAQLVLQALEDRGLSVAESAVLSGPGDATQQLAAITEPAARDMLARACETLDSLPMVDEVVAVMDCVGLG